MKISNRQITVVHSTANPVEFDGVGVRVRNACRVFENGGFIQSGRDIFRANGVCKVKVGAFINNFIQDEGIERMGTGIRDMIRRCKNAGLPELEIRIDGGFFVLTIQRKKSEEGTKSGPSRDQVTAPVTAPVGEYVTRSNGIVRTHTQTLNEEGVAISKVFPAGTILITIAANIGYTGILEFDSAAPDSLIGLTVGGTLRADFLNFYLRTQQPEMDRMAPKGTQKNIVDKKGGDNSKVINLVKSIGKAAEEQSDDPYLIAMAERARVVQEAFEDRQATTAETLAKLLREVEANEARKKEQAAKGIDGLTFFVYRMLEDAKIGNAEAVSRKIREAFVETPNWKRSDSQLRELRKKVTFAIFAECDDLDTVTTLVNDLFRVLEKADRI